MVFYLSILNNSCDSIKFWYLVGKKLPLYFLKMFTFQKKSHPWILSHCFHAQGIFMTWKEYLHVAQGFNKCRYTCHISIHTVAYIYITHKWCECRHIRKEQCIYTVFIYAYIHIRAYTWPNYNIWPTWISLKQFLFPVLNPPIRGGNRSCLRSLKIWPKYKVRSPSPFPMHRWFSLLSPHITGWTTRLETVQFFG